MTTGASDLNIRPAISAGECALAWTQVQNTMSRHAYYHGAGKHLDEVNTIWVREDGPYGRTATWSNPQGIHEGLTQIKEYYVVNYAENQQNVLAAMNKIHPEIKNSPENFGIGSLIVHTQTTPVIEIAGDGKTAKGIWYSPGMSLITEVKDGREVVSGNWYWEKYAADFVKEDGVWKIWHFHVYYDFAPGLNTDWTEVPEVPEHERKDTGAPEGFNLCEMGTGKPNPNPYQSWSPTTVPKMMPRLPEPYYTFSETFSY